MLRFPRTARSTPEEVEAVFKAELAATSPDELPLQQGMAHGNVAKGDGLTAMVIRTEVEPERYRIRAGLFFSSLVAGCACHNDPTPMADEAEYCEADFVIRRPDGATQASLVD